MLTRHMAISSADQRGTPNNQVNGNGNGNGDGSIRL